jgi:hypothetical protein
MLLEQLAKKAGQPPEYDWDAYYRWLFSELAGREVNGYGFWQCEQCFTVNVAYLPARYGTCCGCKLTHLPGQL